MTASGRQPHANPLIFSQFRQGNLPELPVALSTDRGRVGDVQSDEPFQTLEQLESVWTKLAAALLGSRGTRNSSHLSGCHREPNDPRNWIP